MRVWRDIDGDRKTFGLLLWTTGGEVRLGRRLYRWRYVK